LRRRFVNDSNRSNGIGALSLALTLLLGLALTSSLTIEHLRSGKYLTRQIDVRQPAPGLLVGHPLLVLDYAEILSAPLPEPEATAPPRLRVLTRFGKEIAGEQAGRQHHKGPGILAGPFPFCQNGMRQPPTAERLRCRQEVAARKLKLREQANISPLSTADLLRQVRQGAERSDDPGA
jgi:hypothetical protein